MGAFEPIPFIENGSATVRNGYRQIVFTPDMVVRPVFSVRTRGSTEYHCTVQKAMEGDIMVRVQWHPYTISFSVLKNGFWKDYWDEDLYNELPSELREFLKPVTRNSFSYLPVGFGWDGTNTEAAQRRIGAVAKFLKGIQPEALEKFKAFALFSTMRGMPTKWERAIKLNNGHCYNGKKEHELVDALVIWFDDGRVEYWDVEFSDKFTFPIGVEKYAKVYFNCYLNSAGHCYGVRWDLYVI